MALKQMTRDKGTHTTRKTSRIKDSTVWWKRYLREKERERKLKAELSTVKQKLEDKIGNLNVSKRLKRSPDRIKSDAKAVEKYKKMQNTLIKEIRTSEKKSADYLQRWDKASNREAGLSSIYRKIDSDKKKARDGR